MPVTWPLAQRKQLWALRVEKGKLGLKGACLGQKRTVSVWVQSASTGRSKGGVA